MRFNIVAIIFLFFGAIGIIQAFSLGPEKLPVTFELSAPEFERATKLAHSLGRKVPELAKEQFLLFVSSQEIRSLKDSITKTGVWQVENLAAVEQLEDGTQVRVQAKRVNFYSSPYWGEQFNYLICLWEEPYILESSIDGRNWQGMSGGFLSTKSGPVKVTIKSENESLVKIKVKPSTPGNINIPRGANGATAISFEIGEVVIRAPIYVKPLPLLTPPLPAGSLPDSELIISSLGFPDNKGPLTGSSTNHEIWFYPNLKGHASVGLIYSKDSDNFSFFTTLEQCPAQFKSLW